MNFKNLNFPQSLQVQTWKTLFNPKSFMWFRLLCFVVASFSSLSIQKIWPSVSISIIRFTFIWPHSILFYSGACFMYHLCYCCFPHTMKFLSESLIEWAWGLQVPRGDVNCDCLPGPRSGNHIKHPILFIRLYVRYTALIYSCAVKTKWLPGGFPPPACFC